MSQWEKIPSEIASFSPDQGFISLPSRGRPQTPDMMPPVYGALRPFICIHEIRDYSPCFTEVETEAQKDLGRTTVLKVMSVPVSKRSQASMLSGQAHWM